MNVDPLADLRWRVKALEQQVKRLQVEVQRLTAEHVETMEQQRVRDRPRRRRTAR